jgi:hypothetical protein
MLTWLKKNQEKKELNFQKKKKQTKYQLKKKGIKPNKSRRTS